MPNTTKVSLIWPAEHGIVTIADQWSRLQGSKVLATYRRDEVDELALAIEVMHEIRRLHKGIVQPKREG